MFLVGARAGRINGQHISLKLPTFSSSFKAL
jgi:hypothetical protein